MTFAVSGLLLFGGLTFLAVWWAEHSILGTIIAFLFGFFAATSGAAPIITNVLSALASVFHGHH